MSVLDWLAYFALGSIVVWGILKVTGIINTPLLIQYYPLFAASYVFGWQMNKLSFCVGEIGDLKKFQNETIRQIHEIKINCAGQHGKK
jgi:hypothetical protein